MNDAPDGFEEELGHRLRHYVAVADLGVGAAPVLEHVTSQPVERSGRRVRPWAAAIVVAAVAVGGSLAMYVSMFSDPGSGLGIAHATVSGVRYDVAAARSLQVASSDMTRYGEITSSDYDWAFAEPVAYSLRGVDPMAALIVPAKPDVEEGALEYFILFGPAEAFPSVCQYFQAGAPGEPDECK